MGISLPTLLTMAEYAGDHRYVSGFLLIVVRVGLSSVSSKDDTVKTRRLS